MVDEKIEQVMLELGRAVFAAQSFETNLANLLLALSIAKGDHHFLDQAAARAWLDKVDRLTVGQLKGELGKLKLLSPEMINDISRLNALRIKVVHHFVRDWVDDIEDDVIYKKSLMHLRKSNSLLTNASNRLYKISKDLIADIID